MVAYEDLVVALTNWRINQGLPTGEDAFAAFETGSVDLALPVADPVELSTSEVVAVDEADAFESAIDEGLDAEGVDMDMEADGLESFAEDETALAESSDLGAARKSELDAPIDADPVASYEATDDGSFESDGEEVLDYGDEETAFGDMPQMDGMDEMGAASEFDASEFDASEFDASEVDASEFDASEVDAAPEVDAASEGEAGSELSAEEFAANVAPLEDPQTEEVDALAVEEEIEQADEIAADDMSVEEFPVDTMPVADGIAASDMEAEAEAIDADNLAVEEVNADEFAAEEVHSEDFSQDEVPTRFGEEDDSESTVMGIGVDELVPPDEG